jgi:hypothetical protein
MAAHDDIFLPGTFQSQQGRRKMDRLLNVLAEEFPQYHSDVQTQAEAGLAIATLMGSVGAWVMYRSRSPEASYDKFRKLVDTAAFDMATKAYPLIVDQIKKHGFQQEPE